MRPLAILFSALGAVLLLLATLQWVEHASAGVQAANDLVVQEMSLNPGGDAYEVSLDGSGSLWISDYTARELWQVSPASGVYTIYPGLGTPNDARADASGFVWWADTEHNRLSRLSPVSDEVVSWVIPGSSQLYGLQVETPEKIWVTDAALPYVYRLDLSSAQLCTYTIPQAGASGYLVSQNGQFWSGDWSNERVYRLDPDLGQLVYWQLPAGHIPEGLAFDASGCLWWSNLGLPILERLDPDTSLVTRYTLPKGSLPEMIAWRDGLLWYGEHALRSIGQLSPAAPSSASFTLISETLPIAPQCASILAAPPVHVTPSTGATSFVTNTYPITTASGGWTIYQLPELAAPWGITFREGDAWFVDTGRQALVRVTNVFTNTLPDQWPIYLPLLRK